MKLCFLDTETTGLSERCEIWEIGYILRTYPADGSSGHVDEEYSVMIRPGMEFAEPTGLRIGRYYERNFLEDEPVGAACWTNRPGRTRRELVAEGAGITSVYQVAARLTGVLDGATLIGAVPWFDERHLQQLLRRHNQVATNHYHLVDVETLAAGRLGRQPPWGFDDLLASYGLKYAEEDRHTALGDARMVRDLYDAVLGSGITDPT